MIESVKVFDLIVAYLGDSHQETIDTYQKVSGLNPDGVIYTKGYSLYSFFHFIPSYFSSKKLNRLYSGRVIEGLLPVSKM
jgi:hypothetical protein